MNTANNTVIVRSSKGASHDLVIVNTAKFPIKFDRQRPGSLFMIYRETSRGLPRSKDMTVYRKAHDHEGFYAYVNGDKSRAIVLDPEDLVQPIKLVKE